MSSLPLTEADQAKFRTKFDNKILEIYIDNSEWRRMERREWVESTIKTIEAYNSKPRKNWTAEVLDLVQTYEVDLADGKKIIRIKAERLSENKTLRLVPMEDYFDVLYDAHIQTDHGSQTEILQHLNDSRIYLPSSAVTWFLKLCKVCQTKRLPRKVPNVLNLTDKFIHGFVEVINMTDRPDSKYNYVLHYIDLSTERTYLRPLETRRVDEVAQELHRLFFDIRCPAILHSPIDTFTVAVIQILKTHRPDCAVIFGKRIQKPQTLRAKIREWAEEYRSNLWNRGIHYISNELNITKNVYLHRETRKPMNLFINSPDNGLKTTSKNIVNDETLKKILQDEFDVSYAVSHMVYETAYKKKYTYKKKSKAKKQTDAVDEEKPPEKKAPSTSLEAIYNKNPEQFDNSLPGPSSRKAFFNSVYTQRKVDEDLHVKHFPIKTYYRKKSKPDAAQNVSNKDEITGTDKTKSEAKTNITEDPQMVLLKRKHDQKKPDLLTSATEDVTDTQCVPEKVLCFNRNLKYINGEEYSKTEQRQKEIRSWTSDIIDLPAEPDETSNRGGPSRPQSIDVNMVELMQNYVFMGIPSKGDIVDSVKEAAEVDKKAAGCVPLTSTSKKEMDDIDAAADYAPDIDLKPEIDGDNYLYNNKLFKVDIEENDIDLSVASTSKNNDNVIDVNNQESIDIKIKTESVEVEQGFAVIVKVETCSEQDSDN